MTPSPSRAGRRLPYHTDADMLELEARRSVHAGMLPSNRLAQRGETATTGGERADTAMRGWTAQQPFEHVDCPVAHLCVLCAKVVDPDHLRDHRCRVVRELESVA